MHERPAGERHISELAITIKESCRFDGPPQGVERGAAGFVQARIYAGFCSIAGPNISLKRLGSSHANTI